MWSRMFGSKEEGPDHLAKQAAALRKALTPDYLNELREYAAKTPYSQLKGLIENIEMAATNPDMSDRFVVDTAQKMVGILNSVHSPQRRLGFEVSDDGRNFKPFDEPDQHGMKRSDYEDQASALASKLAPHVPRPKMRGRVDSGE